MKFQRSVWALLAAGMLFSAVAISEANAFGRRGSATWSASNYSYPEMAYPHYYYNPYVLPLPAYGILPPSFSPYNQGIRTVGTGLDYDSVAQARKRNTLYPAVEEKTAEERLLDLRRVRFEINVPHADAEVTFNGLPTKQTGLTRVFMTPPMQVGKEYPVTIDARWKVQDTKESAPRWTAPRPVTFAVVAGQKVSHTFKE